MSNANGERLSSSKLALLERLRRGAAKTEYELKIRPRKRESLRTLSVSQRRFLPYLRGGADLPPINHYIIIKLTGPLNVSALEEASREIVRRHENLRTVFKPKNDIVEPVVMDAIDLFRIIECHSCNGDKLSIAINLAKEDGRKPYDTSVGPLIRETLYHIDDNTYILSLAIHIALFDVWSMGIIVNELSALYNYYVGASSYLLPDVKLQYADFADWQNTWINSDEAKRHIDFWKSQLEEVYSNELRIRKSRDLDNLANSESAKNSDLLFSGDFIPIGIPNSLIEAAKRYGQSNRCSLFVILLAAYILQVSESRSDEWVTIGVPVANRENIEIQNVVGFFPNLVLIVIAPRRYKTYSDFINALKEIVSSAFSHQEFPMPVLLEQIGMSPAPGRPIVEFVFSLQNTPMPPLSLAGITTEAIELDYGIMSYDLSIVLVESDVLMDSSDEMGGMLYWNTRLFTKHFVTDRWKHYLVKLENLIANSASDPIDFPLERLR